MRSIETDNQNKTEVAMFYITFVNSTAYKQYWSINQQLFTVEFIQTDTISFRLSDTNFYIFGNYG